MAPPARVIVRSSAGMVIGLHRRRPHRGPGRRAGTPATAFSALDRRDSDDSLKCVGQVSFFVEGDRGLIMKQTTACFQDRCPSWILSA